MAELNKLNKKSQKRNNRAGFLFLLPLIVIFIGLLGYSFYFLIVNSFRDVTITFRHTEFTGLANYKTVLTDLKFWRSLLNTFILSAANIFCGLTFGFFIAIVLNFKMKGNYQSAVARRWIGCTGTEMAGGSQTCYFFGVFCLCFFDWNSDYVLYCRSDNDQ